MSGTKGKTHYPLETKLEGVRLHEEEDLTYAQVAERLRGDPLWDGPNAIEHEGCIHSA